MQWIWTALNFKKFIWSLRDININLKKSDLPSVQNLVRLHRCADSVGWSGSILVAQVNHFWFPAGLSFMHHRSTANYTYKYLNLVHKTRNEFASQLFVQLMSDERIYKAPENSTSVNKQLCQTTKYPNHINVSSRNFL